MSKDRLIACCEILFMQAAGMKAYLQSDQSVDVAYVEAGMKTAIAAFDELKMYFEAPVLFDDEATSTIASTIEAILTKHRSLQKRRFS